MASCSQGGISLCSWFSPPGCGWYRRTMEEGEGEWERGENERDDHLAIDAVPLGL